MAYLFKERDDIIFHVTVKKRMVLYVMHLRILLLMTTYLQKKLYVRQRCSVDKKLP